MDLGATMTAAAEWLQGPNLLFAGAAMTLFLVLVYGRRDELGLHAVQNTAATVLIYTINIIAAILFGNEINDFAQRAYDALQIPTLPADFWQGPMLALGLVIAVALKDFCDYLIHWLMHRRWLWPAHAAHHSDTHVNAFTSFRVHLLEGMLMTINYIVVLTWLQLPELYPLIMTALSLHNMYVHMNLDWTHGRLRYLIASPEFHRWHHADVPEAYGKNLANLIPLYDVIFGTYHEPGPCRAPLGGLQAGLDDKNPVAIWVYPFQQWGRMIRQGAVRLLPPRADRSPGADKTADGA